MAARRGSRVTRLTARVPVALGVLALVLGAVTACGSGPPPGGGSLAASGIDLTGQTLTVGGKEFAEQLVLCHIQVGALRSVGATVVDRCATGDSARTRQALLAGEIDMYWSYTGTGWTVDLGRPERVPGADAQWRAVRDADAANGVVWTARTPFDDTYAIATSAAVADATGVRTVSDLARSVNAGGAAGFCAEPEFAARADGLPAVVAAYGITRPLAVTPLGADTAYQAVADATPCAFGEVFSTDGRIAGLDLRVLDDDRDVFGAYHAANTVRRDVVDRAPDVVRVSDEIARRLDDTTMLGLNGQVAAQGRDPERVARDWLRLQGLVARDSA